MLRLWLKLAETIGTIQTVVILSFIYWTIGSISSIPVKLFSDPLSLKNSLQSTWKDHKEPENVLEYLKKQGIYTNIHYKPIHLQTYYKKLGFKKNDFKNAEFYYERALSLPIHPNLKKKKLMIIIKKINNFLR